MSSNSGTYLQARDRQLLTDLALTPLDSQQLLQLSQRYAQVFPSLAVVRRRMRKLQELGLVNHFHYLTATNGSMKYYKLSQEGYRFVHGPNQALPSRSYFKAVSPSLQKHTRSLSDFFVQTLTAAHNNAVHVLNIYGENELELKLNERKLRLDAATQLRSRGTTYACLFELDCGTEPVFSRKQRESLAQKVRFIFEFEKASKHRFKHYTLFATPSARMYHYLQMVRQLSPDPRRPICFAALLDRFLATRDPFRTPVWVDHHGHLTTLMPSKQRGGKAMPTFEPTLAQQLLVA